MSKISHTDILNLDFTYEYDFLWQKIKFNWARSQIIPWKDYVISIKVWLMSLTKEQAVYRTHLG